MFDLDDPLPRGVYRAPWYGPRHELILYAVDHNHCHLTYESGGVRYLEPGENPFTVYHELQDLLDERDPLPADRDLGATG